MTETGDGHVAAFLVAVGERARWILLATLLVAIMAVVFSIAGYEKGRDAQVRVSQIEAKRAAEERGRQIAKVATCYASARGRPQLILILRALNSVTTEVVAKNAISYFINQYSSATPDVPECDALAMRSGLDPKKYDPGVPGVTTTGGQG